MMIFTDAMIEVKLQLLNAHSLLQASTDITLIMPVDNLHDISQALQRTFGNDKSLAEQQKSHFMVKQSIVSNSIRISLQNKQRTEVSIRLVINYCLYC